jgi:phage head maturation protease
MANRVEKRSVGPLDMRAVVSSINPEKRTFEVMFGTGAKVLRSSWYDGQFYEELSMDPAAVRMTRLTSGTAPLLANHDGYSVADIPGVVESARIENGKGIATVRMVSEGIDPEADKIFRKVQDKIIRNVSVGYRTYKVEKTEGADPKIPTLRAVDWEPYEISLVAMGAEQGASVRSAPDQHEVEITTRGAAPVPKEHSEMTPEEIQKLEQERAAAEAKRAADIEAEVTRRLQAAQARDVGIRAAVKSANLEPAFAEKLIGDTKVSLADARALVLDEMATRADAFKTERHVPTTGGETGNEKFMRGAVSALLMATVPALVRQAKDKKVNGFESVDLDPGELRAFAVSDFAREALERSGVSTRSMDRETLAKRAFTMSKRDGGPYAGTADFPVLLENTMGKILMGAYQTTPDTWSRVCKTDSVDDFRASPRYRSGSLSVLDSLSENGEFKNKAIPDGAKLSISTATKGNIVAISRQLVINDDMSALADLMTKMGRAARLSIEVDFYALLAQNGGLGPTVGANPFFHASNGNTNATASDITALGIDADRVVMGSQKDAQSNEYLDLRPEVLLIPIGKGATARILNSSAVNPDANGKIQQPNAVNGLFRDIVDTARLTGTRRYLFANPDVAPAFVVAFLKGQQSPVLESELGWRVDGTEMKVRFDYLVQPFDVKGAVTNAGL